MPGPLATCDGEHVNWFSIEAMEAATNSLAGVPVVAVLDDPSDEWKLDRSRSMAGKLFESG